MVRYTKSANISLLSYLTGGAFWRVVRTSLLDVKKLSWVAADALEGATLVFWGRLTLLGLRWALDLVWSVTRRQRWGKTKPIQTHRNLNGTET